MSQHSTLPSHLQNWIADGVVEDTSVVTGTADEVVMTLKFDNGIGYRPGEEAAERAHIARVVQQAPALMQALREMMVQVKSNGPVDIENARRLLSDLDALDPTQDPRFPPLNYLERIEMAKRNGEIK